MGFKTFVVGNTNIRWNPFAKQPLLDLQEKDFCDTDALDFMPGTNMMDVAYEVILKQRNVCLSEKMEQLYALGEQTFLYGTSYLICLEKIVDRVLIKISRLEPFPMKIFFRDSAFQDDFVLKEETIRRLALLRKRKNISKKCVYTVEFI